MDGAVKDTAADPLPLAADTAVGASGSVYGLTDGLVAAEVGPVPLPFTSLTVKV